MEQPTRRYFAAQCLNQHQAAAALDGPERVNVPLRTLRLVDAHIGWLAAHGEPYVLLNKRRIDAVRNLADVQPLLIRKSV